MRAWLLITALLLLAGCTGDEITHAVGGGFKSWCRNAPDRCTVAER